MPPLRKAEPTSTTSPEEKEEEEEEVIEEEEYDDEGKVASVVETKRWGSSSSIPPVLQSVKNLRQLHLALSKFVHQWDALQHTIDSINISIDARTKELDALGTPNQDQNQNHEGEEEEKGKGFGEDPKEPPRSELELLCKSMGGKALRKYVAKHLSDLDRLRKEVPEALKNHAPNPAKLVLDAMGRFYLQGRKAYLRPDSDAVNLRRASILILEFYILSGCSPQSDPSVKEEAEVASIAWRNRLITEGGIETAGAVDALGLVLFLASFGIPPEFRTRDLCNILKLSNLEKKADIFRRSPILSEKLPDIINDMIAKDMHVEAVDLIFAFELDKKFPPVPLLSSFVKKSMEAGKQERKEGQCSLRSLKEANERQLAALKSVIKCLEHHRIDASEIANFNINQKIAKLENDISKGVRKLQGKNFKRKSEDAEALRKLENQFKHRLPASVEASQGLVDRNGVGLLSGDVRGPLAGGWHGNEALYGSSFGHGLFGMPSYSSGSGSTGMAAAGGQSFYHPMLPSPLGTGGRNLYQFADTVLEQESYYGKSRTSNVAVPTAINPGSHSSC